MNDFSKFYSMEPMKYYDCGGDFSKQSAIDMINNKNNMYIASWKHDGEWARLIVGEDGEVTIQSRSISKVTGTYGDKTELVPQLVEAAKKLFPPQTVVLGEICFPELSTSSKDVGAILRCKPAKAQQRQLQHPLHFYAFDLLAYNGEDYTEAAFEDRFTALVAAFKYNDYDLMHITATTDHDFPAFIHHVLSLGGEGVVIHSCNYKYTPGKRPAWTTLKVKKSTGSIDVPVVGFLAPNRRYEGQDEESWTYWEGVYDDGEIVHINHAPCNIDMEAGLTWTPVTKPWYYGWENGIIVDVDGKQVSVTSGLTDEDRAWLATDEAAEALMSNNLIAEVAGMEITSDGSLRHPRLIRIRTDAQ